MSSVVSGLFLTLRCTVFLESDQRLYSAIIEIQQNRQLTSTETCPVIGNKELSSFIQEMTPSASTSVTVTHFLTIYLKMHYLMLL